MEYYKTVTPDLYDWTTGETTIQDAIYTETERKNISRYYRRNVLKK